MSVLLVVGLIGTACGGSNDDAGEGGSSSGSSSLESVAIAHTATIDPGDVNMKVGPLEYGADFGLAESSSDVKYLEGHALAMQLLLSGQVDVVGGSFVSDLQVMDKGEDLKVFCPGVAGWASRIVGVGDITSLDQVTDPNTRIAIESPGGPVNFFFDEVLKARGIDATTTTFENVAIIEDSPLRLGALANGDADVSIIGPQEVEQLKDEVGAENVHVLSDVMQDVGGAGLWLAWAAPTEWLDAHLDEAAALCASEIKAGREYMTDFNLYKQTVNQYLPDAGLSDDILQQIWNETKEYSVFPLDPVIDPAGVDLVIQTAKDTGLLPQDSTLSYETVVDQRAMDRAAELLEQDEASGS